MRFHGTLFCVAALSAVVGLLIFADNAWAPGYCGDGWVNPDIGEECEVGVPCAEPGDTCDEAACRCSPPPSPSYCSPGFWKNHPEVWEAGICCIGLASDPQSQCGELDAQLRAKGPGGSFIRKAAQAVLSACFADPPCDD